MKKLLTLFILLICIIINFSSCEQNSIEENTKATEQMPESINFKYQGKSYTSSYQVIDKDIVYSNKEVKELLEKFTSNPNLATLIDENGNVEYFDNYKELYTHLSIPATFSNIVTKATSPAIASCSIYVNTKYKGSSKKFTTTGKGNGAYYTNLSTIGFANNISSIKLNANPPYIGSYNVHVTLWDQTNYTGHSITWRITYQQQNQNIPDLSKYLIQIPMIATWSDSAQSLQFGV